MDLKSFTTTATTALGGLGTVTTTEVEAAVLKAFLHFCQTSVGWGTHGGIKLKDYI